MSETSRTIRRHHAALRRTMRAHLRAVAERPSRSRERAFVDFLQNELLPHAQGEERAFYPAMDAVLRQHGRPTGTMILDHERIVQYIRRLDRAAQREARSRPSSRKSSAAAFGRLSLELGALLDLHFEKEERDYLPLFEKHLDESEQMQVLGRMHEGPESAPSTVEDE